MKLTAVEFLHSEYKKIFGNVVISTEQLFIISDNLEKAKELEKQQIIDAFEEGSLDIMHSQQYYEENFNQ